LRDYIIEGFGVDEKIVKKAMELSEDRHCGAIVSLNTNITHTYRIDPPTEEWNGLTLG
jgi:uncharacterized OsmC-like protein